MATSSRTRAERSRDAQAAVAAAAAALAVKAFADVDVHRLNLSLPQLRLQVAAVIRQYAPAARTAAIRFYLSERRAAGVPGSVRVRPVELPPLEQIAKAVDYAAAPLWGQSDAAAAEKRLEAVVERLVLNTGREQVVAAVEQDRAAKGWARVPEADCCSFCAMLATRGAIYKSETTATKSSRADREGEEYHDHCRCHAEPSFTVYEPTAQVRQWQADYKRLRDELGHSPSLNQWRQNFEGRAVDGLPEPPAEG